MSESDLKDETPDASQATFEQLTAYLDGELDAEQSRQIDERLAAEPALRQQLQHLEKAWRMLDDLPRQEVASTFTSTTLAMAAVREADEAALETTAAGASRRWVLWPAALFLAAAGGFLGVALARPDPNRLLLADLPVIENLDAYRHAESIDFLRKLQASGLFTDKSSGSKPADSKLPAANRPGETIEAKVAVSERLSQRRERVAKLAPADRERLLDKYDRYQRLDEAERERLRQLDRDINSAADGAALRELLVRYDLALNRLPAAQRQELLALPGEQRIQRMQEARRAERFDMTRRLTPADAAAVADWLEKLLARLGPAEAERLVRRIALQQGFAGDQGRGPVFNDLMTLREQLSEPAREQLNKATTPQQKLEVLTAWMRQGLMTLAMRKTAAQQGELTPERMWNFFQHELSDADRQRLMGLPAEEMKQQLWRLYQIQSLVPNRPAGSPSDNSGANRRRPNGEPGKPNERGNIEPGGQPPFNRPNQFGPRNQNQTPQGRPGVNRGMGGAPNDGAKPKDGAKPGEGPKPPENQRPAAPPPVADGDSGPK
ncbi:MAG: hypothetical protein JSS27_09385 [Planctomycetes bacterium]|nr:hypothetical protein [Planctomycetota bacterium]